MAFPQRQKEFFRYIPVSEADVRWGLYVTGAGWVHCVNEDPYPLLVHPDPYQFEWESGRVLPDYCLGYVMHGDGVMESSYTGEIPIRGPCLVMTFPGIWHRYRRTTKKVWTEYWVALSGEHMHRLLRQGFISPTCPILETGEDKHLRKAYEALIAQVRMDNLRTHAIAASAMLVVAEALEAACVRPELKNPELTALPAEDALVAEAIQWIWDHSQRTMTVESVVKQLPVTRRSLERRFRRAVGHSILDEINRSRLERAKLLLEETDLPIKKVASTVGFTRIERMNETFKRNLGITAVTYRHQLQREQPPEQ